MSITKDFEKRNMTFDADGDPDYHDSTQDVDQLLAHTRNLEAMLRKHEWARYDSEWGLSHCPECSGDRDDTGWITDKIGHSPDCELARLIE